jgi:probable HAF family extracellular repeat protein
MTQNRTFAFTFAMSVVALLAGATARAASITNLGVLPGGTASYANGVSADGSAIAGYCIGSLGGSARAFRWMAAGGMQNLGTLEGSNSYGHAISGNGSAVAGSSFTSGGDHAFRWTIAGGMQDLGTTLPSGWQSSAWGINGDGSAAAITTYFADISTSTYLNNAYRWTMAGGLERLGVSEYSGAKGISADGSAIVGYSDSHAFRWTVADGMQDLGVLPTGTWTVSSAVSSDGSIVTGTGNLYSELGTYLGYHAFLWTAEGGMKDLGVFAGGALSFANAISGDGLSVAGSVYAAGLSYDGSVIVGNGTYNGQPRGWIAVVPEPCAAMAIVGAPWLLLRRSTTRRTGARS